MKNIFFEKELDNEEMENAIIEGYVVSLEKDNFKNWISEYGDPKNILNFLEENGVKNVAVLKNVYVPEENRNKGIGDELLECFIEEAFESSAQVIFLEVDTGESNNFSLNNWYSDYGFEFLPERVKFDSFKNIMILIAD